MNMLRRSLQANQGRRLVLLAILLSFFFPAWVRAQRDILQRQGTAHREDQFRALTASATPGTDQQKNGYTKHQLGYYLDPNQVSFVRPGLQFAIQNVIIGADNRIRVTYLI